MFVCFFGVGLMELKVSAFLLWDIEIMTEFWIWIWISRAFSKTLKQLYSRRFWSFPAVYSRNILNGSDKNSKVHEYLLNFNDFCCILESEKFYKSLKFFISSWTFKILPKPFKNHVNTKSIRTVNIFGLSVHKIEVFPDI